MIKKGSLIIFVFLSINTSCISVYRFMGGFKNPKVETKTSIKNFVKNSELDDAYLNLLFDKVPKDEIKKITGNMFLSKLIIYDREGKRKCYDGNETCEAVQLAQIAEDYEHLISDCNDTIDRQNYYYFDRLDSLLAHTVSLENKKITKRDLPAADYYFMYNWSIYAQSKKITFEDYLMFKDWLKKINKKVFIIKINNDLREDWGLKKGKKMKMLIRKTGHKKYDMKFGKLPLK